MRGILLHSDITCFMFPFCGHDWGSRFVSLIERYPEMNGHLLSCFVLDR